MRLGAAAARRGLELRHASCYFSRMARKRVILNLVVAAGLALAPMPGAAKMGQGVEVESLLAELARPDQERWARIERQILREWSRSGSAVADYLFQRGQAALRAGRTDEAIDHFSAVIDHAPDFAEGWNGRATAYYQANRLGQSMADIEAVLARNPNHFAALTGLGIILEQLELYKDAREAYAAAHDIHPHRPSIKDALARLDRRLQGVEL
jgi:tetratricopeptide (TPR) repeat protein